MVERLNWVAYETPGAVIYNTAALKSCRFSCARKPEVGDRVVVNSSYHNRQTWYQLGVVVELHRDCAMVCLDDSILDPFEFEYRRLRLATAKDELMYLYKREGQCWKET